MQGQRAGSRKAAPLQPPGPAGRQQKGSPTTATRAREQAAGRQPHYSHQGQRAGSRKAAPLQPPGPEGRQQKGSPTTATRARGQAAERQPHYSHQGQRRKAAPLQPPRPEGRQQKAPLQPPGPEGRQQKGSPTTATRAKGQAAERQPHYCHQGQRAVKKQWLVTSQLQHPCRPKTDIS